MRNLLAVIFMLWGALLHAQEDDIQNVISSQIDAFEVNDFTAAFSYASPNIQNYFGGPERFEDMVRRGYPMVLRPEELNFLELRTDGDRFWQAVRIRDMSGELFFLEYQMIQLDVGWRINGVRFFQPDMSV